MSAALMFAAVAGGVAMSALAAKELSRRVRLVVGDSGAAEATLGFECVVKRSWIVLAECLRFKALELADIGRLWREEAVAQVKSGSRE